MKITVLGMGAFGIAIGKAFHENDNKVTLWTKFKEEADIVKLNRENINCFPGVKVPRQIVITDNLEEAVNDAKIIVFAVPMSAVRETAIEVKKYLKDDQVICIAAKGIERKTNKLMSQVIYEETGSENIAMLSGPTFAIDIVKGNQIGFMIASESSVARTAVKICLENKNIVVNMTRDIIGVQVMAAVKNVFAILLGALDGAKKADSTKAAVISILANDLRIISEIMGAKAHTIFTFSGIGDLVLTCTNSKSRNYSFGKCIGQGLTKDEAMEKLHTTTIEGLYTIESLKAILEDKEITIKSVDYIYNLISNKENLDNVISKINK